MKPALRLLRAAALAALSTLAAAVAFAGDLRVGDRIQEMDTGRQVYRDVTIRAMNARTVTIQHPGGMVSLLLRDLPVALRARLGYDPRAEAAADLKFERERAHAEALRAAEEDRARTERSGALQRRYEQLMQDFTGPAVPRAEVDLRPRFAELSLGVKNQGRRPSCAIFAITGAFEYLNAEIAGKAERLSEEYLLWATLSVARKPAAGERDLAPSDVPDEADPLHGDTGFSLEEVALGLRTFGIPPASSMPNTFGKALREIPAPSPAVIEEARGRRQVAVHRLPGRDTASVLQRVVQVLNAGIPVPIGVRWPHYATLRRAYLSEQQTVQGYSHAVTIVGYRCPTGKIEDCVFIFRNSYGNQWGQAGYGNATWSYLHRNLLIAILLEVAEREAAAGRAAQ